MESLLTLMICQSLIRPFEGSLLPLAVSSHAFKAVCRLLNSEDYSKPIAAHDGLKQVLLRLFTHYYTSYNVKDVFEAFFVGAISHGIEHPLTSVEDSGSERSSLASLQLLADMRLNCDSNGLKNVEK